MKKTVALFAVAAASLLSGCGSMNAVLAERHESVEMYHIFDVRTSATPDTVIKATADGLARNTNSVVQNRPLQVGVKVPATAGRFELVNVADSFKGTGIGSLMALGGGAGNTAMRVAKCDGAVWTSKATRDTGSDSLNLYTCLYRYKSGYQLNMYAVFRKSSGGLAGLARGAAAAVVGTPEEWVNKTVIDMVRSVETATGSKVAYVEGQPELGDLPKVDEYDRR
ncbi:hypothetical protein D3C71_24270 [compost metagenome]